MLNLLKTSKKKGLIIISIALLAILVTVFMVLLPKEKEETAISHINLKQQNTYNAVTIVNGTSWYYDLDEDGNAINVHYKEGELGENVTIPETLDGHAVVKIECKEGYNNYNNIFGDKRSSIKTVVIPKGVTSIVDSAFRECSSLTSINIPEGVTSIGNYAFKDCGSLTSINIPERVTRIGRYAFYKCSSLTNINIPEGVTSIEDYTFYKCSSLTSINIPEGVTCIGNYAFWGCEDIKGNLIIPNSVTRIGAQAFIYCRGLTGELKIPNSVTTIGSLAFCNCSGLTGSLVIPNSITSIGFEAFNECSGLTEVEIPDSVSNIGNYAFYRCNRLTDINVSSNNKDYSSMDGILFNKEKTTLIQCPEENEKNNYIIPSSVTRIEKYAFYKCRKLTGNIVISNSVISIGDDAFEECSLMLSVPSQIDNIQEIELPELIKRTKIEGDILYTDKKFTLNNCELTEDGNRLKIELNEIINNNATLKVNSGCLKGLTVVLVLSGTITYDKEKWTNSDVVATIHLYEGETITNNNGNNQYIFTENGEFAFQYKDNNNIDNVRIAKVRNIDKKEPTINSISGNPTEWTNDNVIISIEAEDELSGITGAGYGNEIEGAYSTHSSVMGVITEELEFSRNIENIILSVRDAAGNSASYGPISISKIDKEGPTINGIEGNPSSWTKENVTLKVNAEDNLSGLANEAYSFDGIQKMQKT